MSDENKNSINQLFLALSAPPYILLILNFLHPFLNYVAIFNDRPLHMDFENQHYLGLWIWLFLIPYIICYIYPNEEKEIFPITQLAACGSAAIALLSPFFSVFDPLFFFMVFLLTSGAMFGLYWKNREKEEEEVDFGRFPLSVDPKGDFGFPTSSLHENVQIVGGTGTGKTHYVIKPFIEQTIKQHLGCFIYDVKSNMGKDVAYYADLANRKYLHFNLSDPLYSHTYNPLYGDNPGAIASRVYHALYYDTSNTERYYVDVAEAFLKNLVGLLMKEIQILTFQDLLTATQEADTFKTISRLCAKYPVTPYASYFREQWLGKSPKDRRMELSGLVNKLQRFCTSEWSFLVNARDPDIKMKRVLESREILLFSPDSARYPEDAKALSILAMMDMAEQLADRYREKPESPFRVFLDEFYNLAYPRFIDFINKCREAEVNLFLAHQSLGDLRGVSQEFLEQVMNTANNKILLRVNDPNTAEHFARQFGTEQDRNYKVESYSPNGQVAGYTKPQVEKFRFHPNQIKELKVGHAIIKIVGSFGVSILESKLRMATNAPVDFNTHLNLKPFNHRSMENESSLPEFNKEVGGSQEKVKSMGGIALEYQNAL